MLEGILIVLGILMLALGVLGAFLPVLPGPPLSFLGLVLIHITKGYHFSTQILVGLGVLAVVITVFDFIMPIYGAKKAGSSRRGVWGAAIGLVAGIFFFPPAGIIVGPMVGALIAELTNNKDLGPATRAAFGSMLGLLAGALLKFAYSVVVIFFSLRMLFTG